jgi:hypothetical protein
LLAAILSLVVFSQVPAYKQVNMVKATYIPILVVVGYLHYNIALNIAQSTL